MKERLLKYLQCPDCGGEIRLSGESIREGTEIITGDLICSDCGTANEVIRGVPRFADPGELASGMAETAENFGWQWTEFTQEDTGYAEQFLGWLQPVRQDEFRDRIVLEGGCGKGRHTRLAAEWGAKEIIGVDLSSAVDTAFSATRDLPNAHIIRADLYKLPLKGVFDYAFSVGVLHHTPDPRTAFLSLASKVRKGGSLSAWVYGKENNGWIIGIVNPVRERITSKIGPRTLYNISKIPTLALYATTKLVYAPLNKVSPKGAKRLFYNDYMNNLAGFGWREQHNIVFDHLVAPTAFYISRREFESWWEELQAQDVKITWHNKNSWCGFGTVGRQDEAA